ncbi:CRISPR-associated endoribonuclease Cas6 [Fulvivirga sedimenti]|uniref:CRISPR-associated endoribonuclease Cas6 n=1 Tax=Fulvivirga sedimenti TaxID=2879465 RepID=A0A9X1HS03_9BACT|nr:CRISPR-associated endoribonuclease Cas6 [Fulvivirga sedimenti]MCA6074939.1 CRISPR-associated endoribonuclease Cas6 [Fulvivirga sedimenti]MCA6076116.1 CRISPR-associated endoribonuclease Cas6 [Fulvivirga sedimenti]MCA6077244.1 CRISPR-associated endoribonuclease Cas6 [Fulvivirga sedimenti]
MRVRIIFLLKNRGSHIPFHHQYLLAQMIKGVLMKGSDEKYINYSFYNFSGLKGQTKISRKGLHYYSSRVTLVLSSPSKDFIDYFLANLFDFPKVELGALALQPEFVELEEAVEMGEYGKFICISPLVLMNSSFNDSTAKRFIPPETDSFSDLLYESTIQRMASTGDFTDEQIASFYKFQLIPDKNYIARLTAQQKKYARIYPVFDQDVKYEVRGYTFPFTLYAAPEVLDFVFNCGLGQFTHKGFGMLDVANSDPNSRVLKYEFNATVH